MAIAAVASIDNARTTASNPGGTRTTTAVITAAVTGTNTVTSKTTGSTGAQVQFGTMAHPYAANSPWNIPLPTNPTLDPNSAAIVAKVLAAGTHSEQGNLPLVLNINGPSGFGMPYYTATPSTPRVALSRKAYSRTTPIDPSWTPNGGADGKMAVWDPVEQVLYDIDGFAQPNTSVWAVYQSYVTGNGDGLQPYSTGRGCTGSAMMTTAGLITLSDLASGSIEHAVCFMTSMPSTSFRYPAGQTDGLSTTANLIQEGMRVQLDPAVNVDAISGATLFEKMLMKALQKYGAFCNDRGQYNNMAMGFYVEKIRTGQTNVYPSYGVTAEYQQLTHIPRANLRIIAASVTYAGMPAPAGGVNYG